MELTASYNPITSAAKKMENTKKKQLQSFLSCIAKHNTDLETMKFHVWKNI